jgi:hypothetical protein
MRERPFRSSIALFAAALSLAFPLAALAGRTEAEKKLDAAIAAKDRAAGAAAIREIAAAADAEAAKTIVAGTVKAAAAGVDLEEEALSALSGLTADSPRKALIKAASEERLWVARFLVVAALARMGLSDAEDAVIAALEDKEPRVGAAAVAHLKAKATRETVGKLVAALPRLDKEKKLAAVRKEVSSALRDLTGVDVDATQDWKNWWDSNGAAFQPKKQERGKGGDDVVTRLRENHPADYKTVERLSGDDILVFKGRSDRVEKVLDALKIPYTLVDRAKLAGIELDPKQVLIFNCNGRADPLSDDDLKKVRDVVAQGAYLFSSDWEAKVLIERLFPGKIETIGESPDEELLVRIRPVAAAAMHPYMRDVFPIDPFAQANFSWKVHQRTYIVKLGEGAVPLVESEDLCAKLQEGKDRRGRKVPVGPGPVPVAVTFRFSGERVETGKRGEEPPGGSVLHVLSHFQDQRTKEGDGFALQQLLLNFIVEKQRARAKFGS